MGSRSDAPALDDCAQRRWRPLRRIRDPGQSGCGCSTPSRASRRATAKSAWPRRAAVRPVIRRAYSRCCRGCSRRGAERCVRSPASILSVEGGDMEESAKCRHPRRSLILVRTLPPDISCDRVGASLSRGWGRRVAATTPRQRPLRSAAVTRKRELIAPAAMPKAHRAWTTLCACSSDRAVFAQRRRDMPLRNR